MKKIKIIFCLVILITISACNVVQAADESGAISAMKGMSPEKVGEISSNTAVTGSVGEIINAAIAIIQVVGTGISLIMVSILGIKYMIAAPNDKADVKKQIMPMLIGAILLFAGVNIIQLIANLTPNVITSS